MKKNVFILGLILPFRIFAQQAEVYEGNKFYKEGKYEEALKAYDKVLGKNPADPTAKYNKANALVKKGDATAALDSYKAIIEAKKEKSIEEQSWYNTGVLHQQQSHLDESIEAWKSALKMAPEDKMARENLQKALREKKQQEEQKKEEPKKQPQQQQQQQKEQPQPKQSRLNQKQVEQLLKSLEQKEKETQKKMLQRSSSPRQQEKDW